MKLLHSYGSDVRVHTFVPVQEAFNIKSVTDLKLLYSIVTIGVVDAQKRLNEER